MCFIYISSRYLSCCYYLICTIYSSMGLIPKLRLPTCPYYGCVRICCGYISTIYSSPYLFLTCFSTLPYSPLIKTPKCLFSPPLPCLRQHTVVRYLCVQIKV